MKFGDLVEYLLWSLYVREQAHPDHTGAYFDLNESAEALGEEVPAQLVFDAARVLETRGLARPLLALGGFAAAALTGEGRLRVEQEVSSNGGVIGEFEGRADLRQRLGALDNEDGDEPTPEEQRAPIFEVLEELGRAVQDVSISQEEKEDLLADVESIRLQLQKHEPNVDVIAGLLERARRYRPLAPSASQMISLLYP